MSKSVAGKVTLRKSITPGTVLILLAGAQKGKRVVFLKQLESGKLLVSGPLKINGVPITRVDQTLVIATSTKVALNDAVNSAIANISDACFQSFANAKKTGEFFVAEKKVQVNPKRVEAQAAVDAALLPVVKAAGADMVAYLASTFSLNKHQTPHTMKF